MKALGRTIFFLIVTVLLTIGIALPAKAAPLPVPVTFSDDFESYAVGANPVGVYDYWDGVNFRWSPAPAPQPDRYMVGLVGGNKVLNYYYGGPVSHFPFVSKLYRQDYIECLQGGATFIYTQPTMGWTGLLFSWQDRYNYYVAQAMFDNRLYLRSTRSGTIGSLTLWPDRHILSMSHRIEVERVGNTLIASLVRLDTGQTKSLSVVNTDYLGGRVGFGFDEDWWGPANFNVDSFHARGTVIPPSVTAVVDIDPDTLNLKSKGGFVTAYIELPAGHDVGDIDVATLRLAGTVPAVTDSRYKFVTDPGSYLVDHDLDGITERMVKFSRAQVREVVAPGEAVELTLTGWLAGSIYLEGSDTIRVIN